MLGTIALDIDGTITAEHHALSKPVVDYFMALKQAGWRFIFITGRTFSWGNDVLQFLPFDYYVAVQNGAIILHMPSKRIVSKKYIDRSVFPIMDQICQNEPTDYVLYTGFEYGDVCYYRPQHFSKELLVYVEHRKKTLKETWFPVESYEGVHQQSFPSLKCIGSYETIARIAQKIDKELGLHVPIIKDPFNPNYYVAQATHANIDKGQALRDLLSLNGQGLPVIAAGDDNNDKSMLAAADYRVVMATAPEEMKLGADIIAPPATEDGIIQGLDEAIAKIGKR